MPNVEDPGARADSERKDSLERILAERRYIEAKLRKFELDQVTEPFSKTRRDQGLARAVLGALHAGFLKAGFRYDEYVGRVASEIQAERDIVGEFETRAGRNASARDLYHRVRDRPETKTYKDSRRAFRRLKHELAQQHAENLESAVNATFVRAKDILHYHRRGLISLASGLAVALAVTLPTHSHFERKDHSRAIVYKKYDSASEHPMNASPISAHNLEMWIFDIWNSTSNQAVSGSSIADEWNEFIKPGANPYNLRKTKNEAGNDWTRPWAHLLVESTANAKRHLVPADRPVQTMAQGAQAENAAWDHSQYDVTHMEAYDCGDSDHPATCFRVVYDYTVHDWTLDAAQLANGANFIGTGVRQFPKLEPARVNRLLETAQSLGYFITGHTRKEVEELVALANRWQESIIRRAYNSMLSNKDALENSKLIGFIADNAESFPKTYHSISYSHSPSDCPHGWDEHERLLSFANDILGDYDKVDKTLVNLDPIVPSIQRQMDILTDPKEQGHVRGALIDFADIGRELHNINYDKGVGMLSYRSRVLLEWLLFLGLAAGTTAGVYKLQDSIEESRYRGRMRSAGIYR
jgi:hypothetical protein